MGCSSSKGVTTKAPKDVDTRKALKEVSLLKGLSSSDLTSVAKVSQLETFDKDEVILKKGDVAEDLFIIVDGKAAVFVGDVQEKEVAPTGSGGAKVAENPNEAVGAKAEGYGEEGKADEDPPPQPAKEADENPSSAPAAATTAVTEDAAPQPTAGDGEKSAERVSQGAGEKSAERVSQGAAVHKGLSQGSLNSRPVVMFFSLDTDKLAKIAALKDGDYFGESALTKNALKKERATIVATTPVQALRVNREAFKALGLFDKIVFPPRKAVGAGCKKKHFTVKPPSPKTDEERGSIERALKANRDLVNAVTLTDENINAVIDAMWKELIPKDTLLITQGDDDADYFYVVQDGCFDILVASDPKNLKTAEKVARRAGGDSFGELALLYSAPRAASAQAVVDSNVWVIDRNTFKKSFMSEEDDEKIKEYVDVISRTPLFQPLTQAELEAVAKASAEVRYSDGEVVMQQGDTGSCVYILLEGEVQQSRGEGASRRFSVKKEAKATASPSPSNSQTPGGAASVFGEEALRGRETRTATLTASGPVRMLRLERETLHAHVGQMEDLLARGESPSDVRTFGLIKMEDLKEVALLGCGGFGAVRLVEHRETKETYALKKLSKGFIVECGLEESVINEKEILMLANSPFIVKLYETYRGTQSLWFLMEAALGGELYMTYNRKGFYGSALHARFYVAGAICAFEYLHYRHVVYRDLKPENMILTGSGLIKLIDMGLAKVVVGKTYTTCGTPDYFAPEVIAQTGHGCPVDWWCTGIFLHELMVGAPPFQSEDPMTTYGKIKGGIDSVEFPSEVKGACENLVKELCTAKPEDRLPIRLGGVKNLRDHEWYEGFDWQAFMAGKMEAPYKPQVKSPKDCSNFHADEEDLPDSIPYNREGCDWDKDFATVPELVQEDPPPKRVMDTE